jgi:hypothetical protein
MDIRDMERVREGSLASSARSICRASSAENVVMLSRLLAYDLRRERLDVTYSGAGHALRMPLANTLVAIISSSTIASRSR